MKLNNICYFLIIFFTFSSYGENIATIKLSYIFEKSDEYQKILLEIDQLKNNYMNELEIIEKNLNTEKKEIEESRMLMSDEEINKRVEIFNQKANDYQILINKYNAHIQKNIEINENIILNEVAKITKELSVEKNLHLIINEDQYFIASESIDISNEIIDALNDIKLNLNLVDK